MKTNMNKNKSKKALITGITGQDGSYLAELLLDKDYEVHGIVRRASTFNTGRIEHLYQDFHIKGIKLFTHYGDLTDTGNIEKIINQVKPDEVYNLGAMSHVRVSFDMPEYTANTVALGTLRVLEAIKNSGLKIKFYQASSSEIFGASTSPQNENTSLHPRSPYAVAKVFAYHMTQHYREAYGIFACNGILFNHESVPSWTPVLIRKNGMLDILPIEELALNYKHERQKELEGIEVWEDEGFVKATAITAYPHDSEIKDKGLTEVDVRSGFIEATKDHIIYTSNGEVETGKLIQGSLIQETVRYPEPIAVCKVTAEWARFLGVFVGDGYAGYSDGKFVAQIRSDNKKFLEEAGYLWHMTTGGGFSFSDARSGFTGKLIKEGVIRLWGAPGILEWLSHVCYTKSRYKRVPRPILNSDIEIWREFLQGYNMADGLKAGHGKYEFRNFKTNSPTLASQLMWMAEIALKQRTILNVDRVYREGEEYRYFSINLNSPTKNKKGSHFKKDRNEIKRVQPVSYRGWLFDVTTESGKFAAGVGNLLIHNSPRRGETFVTRKITRGIARIKAGLDKKIYLGNLDAKRDWGYAPEFVNAMYLMLQQKEPDDFVIATGETHSVREFLEEAFRYSGLGDWQKYVEIDPRYFRPTEVEVLIGDAAKAKEKLGWEAKTKFRDLVKIMVDADCKSLSL